MYGNRVIVRATRFLHYKKRSTIYVHVECTTLFIDPQNAANIHITLHMHTERKVDSRVNIL